MSNQADASEDAFRGLFQRTSRRVYGYVRRQCAESDCDDVIAEVYVTAWRHFDALPPDPVPWLLRAARNAIANHRRTMARQGRLRDAMQHVAEVASPDLADQAVARADLLVALGRLKDADREILLLAAWDGLDSTQIGIVLGISAATARARLSRARRRLAAHPIPERTQPSEPRRDPCGTPATP